MVSDFHKRGVHVLFPYNPWDQHTRYEGKTDCEALAELIASVGADGFSGDTMPGVPESFYQCGVDAGIHLAIEPEGDSKFDHINWWTF